MNTAEQIRQRLLVLLKTVDVDIPAERVYRNRAEFESEELPAITLLDGSTIISQTSTPANRGLTAARFVVTVPQIFVVLKRGTDVMSQADKGSKLSSIEDTVIRLFSADPELSNLLGEQGYIEYRSSVTDFQTGSTVEGQMQMDFAFAYIFNPRKL